HQRMHDRKDASLLVKLALHLPVIWEQPCDMGARTERVRFACTQQRINLPAASISLSVLPSGMLSISISFCGLRSIAGSGRRDVFTPPSNHLTFENETPYSLCKIPRIHTPAVWRYS